MATKPFIGIKRLWYAKEGVFTEDLTGSKLKALLSTSSGTSQFTEIKNSHQDTFEYSQDDPEITDYINELTGKPYYRDMTSEGNKTISFTIGEYDFATKVALQGGSLTSDSNGWKAPESPEIVYKAIVAQTKTGNYVVFTHAGIVGKTNMAEKNMGLGVTAVAMDNPTNGVADEYWFAKEAVDGAA